MEEQRIASTYDQGSEGNEDDQDTHPSQNASKVIEGFSLMRDLRFLLM